MALKKHAERSAGRDSNRGPLRTRHALLTTQQPTRPAPIFKFYEDLLVPQLAYFLFKRFYILHFANSKLLNFKTLLQFSQMIWLRRNR